MKRRERTKRSSVVPAIRLKFSLIGDRLRKIPKVAFLLLAVTGASIAIAIGACGKIHDKGTASPGSTGLFVDPEDSAHPRGAQPKKPYELDARGQELFDRAKNGDEPDVARFGAYVGAAGLIELSRKEETRPIAIAAMAYSPGFSCAGVLSEIAAGGSEADATSALESLHEIAARRREQADLEDFQELRFTCDTLLALAKDASESKKDRARRATSVLRMLSDRGCEAPPIGAPTAPADAGKIGYDGG